MKDRISILHVITDLSIGGAQSVLVRLVQATDPSELVHRVVSLRNQGANATRLTAGGIAVQNLDVRGLANIPLAPFRLAGLLRKARPDVVQGWMYHGNLMASLAVARGDPVPVVYGLHHGALDPRADRWLTRLIAKLGARFARRSACVVSCSESGARFHEALGYPGDKLRVIPNGFDLESFRPEPAARQSLRRELDVGEETPLIGAVARFAPVKNHRMLLEAARLVLDHERKHEGVHFVLCGEGVQSSNPTLEGWIRELGLNARVHLLGPRTDVDRIYAGVDVATSCSISEAFPLTVGEAMACGTPCAVTDVGDSALLVGETGRVVPPNDPVAMARAWSELLALPASERLALGLAARRRIEARFSLPAMARAYAELYRDLLEARPPSLRAAS